MQRLRRIPLQFVRREPADIENRARCFLDTMLTRRTVRDYSPYAVSESVIRHAIAAANSAPSGANMQPWHFVAVRDPETKRRIREAAEAEEHELYAHRASDEWLQALAPLGTDANKPFLESAPWLIAVFARKFTVAPDGSRRKHYYTPESVGIATGFLVAALHHAGLATLTHTPSPMGFLRELLGRPDHERPYVLLVTGYPAESVEVPDLEKLGLDDVLTIV